MLEVIIKIYYGLGVFITLILIGRMFYQSWKRRGDFLGVPDLTRNIEILPMVHENESMFWVLGREIISIVISILIYSNVRGTTSGILPENMSIIVSIDVSDIGRSFIKNGLFLMSTKFYLRKHKSE